MLRDQLEHVITQTLNVISKKWVVGILLVLSEERRLRFSEFQDYYPNLSNKVLSDRLSELVELNIVDKVVHNIVPLTIKYELQSIGKQIIDAFYDLGKIGIQLSDRDVSEQLLNYFRYN